ncbi:hypothetical protein ACIQFZ_25020 [Streptomyces sp. NPDC093064]|uniref:hypothetical protein n=1 Tax=Streptomyces sp. NPDC093064 TaxID=3366020 RepID=UPI003817D5C5
MLEECRRAGQWADPVGARVTSRLRDAGPVVGSGPDLEAVTRPQLAERTAEHDIHDVADLAEASDGVETGQVVVAPGGRRTDDGEQRPAPR